MEIPHPYLSGATEREFMAAGPTSKPTGHTCPKTGGNADSAPRSSPAALNTEATKWVILARIVRPHGRHGEVVADILTDFPERFHDRPQLWLVPPQRVTAPPREVLLENFWFLRSRVVLKLKGVDSISGAEGVRGYDLAVPAGDRAPLEPDSWYASDLIGCRVIDLSRGSTDIGEIVDIDRGSSSTDLLVVRGAGSGASDLLIPFVRDYLVRVETSERRVEMRLPEGLVDINGPLSEEEKRLARGE